MENNIELKFEMPYIDCLNFKEKELQTIINIISGSRVGQLISFNGYYNISFNEEDKQHWKPILSNLESFSRSKTNCFSYNILNGNKYDKVFIYQTGGKEGGFYGFLFLNSIENKSLHLYNLKYDYTSLIVYLNQMVQKN